MKRALIGLLFASTLAGCSLIAPTSDGSYFTEVRTGGNVKLTISGGEARIDKLTMSIDGDKLVYLTASGLTCEDVGSAVHCTAESIGAHAEASVTISANAGSVRASAFYNPNGGALRFVVAKPL
jgi:hypothetical protein